MYEFIYFLILLVLGFIVGSILEKKHFKSINEREEKLLNLPTITLKKPLNEENIVQTELVYGSVVVSIDFFKKFIAGLVNFFGGNIVVYDTLLNRARREAILRMKESALNASEIINLKVETSSIHKSAKRIGAVEITAYGTAIYR